VDRAVGVYRSMLRVDPANERAARRLGELLPGPAAPAERPAPGWSGVPSAPDAPPAAGDAAAVSPVLRQAPGADTRRAAIFRLQTWLSSVQTSNREGRSS